MSKIVKIALLAGAAYLMLYVGFMGHLAAPAASVATNASAGNPQTPPQYNESAKEFGVYLKSAYKLPTVQTEPEAVDVAVDVALAMCRLANQRSDPDWTDYNVEVAAGMIDDRVASIGSTYTGAADVIGINKYYDECDSGWEN